MYSKASRDITRNEISCATLRSETFSSVDMHETGSRDSGVSEKEKGVGAKKKKNTLLLEKAIQPVDVHASQTPIHARQRKKEKKKNKKERKETRA